MSSLILKDTRLDNSLLLSHNNDEFTKKEMQIDYMQLETLILSLKRNDSILGNSLSMLWNMSQISVLHVRFLFSALWLDQMTMSSQSNLTCRWSRSGPKPVYQKCIKRINDGIWRNYACATSMQ